jgi:hypothetical protein
LQGLLDKSWRESNLLCPFGSQSLLLLFCLVYEFLLTAYWTVEINRKVSFAVWTFRAVTSLQRLDLQQSLNAETGSMLASC